MSLHALFRTVQVAALLALLPGLAQAAQGDLMRVTTTTRMEIPGAPAQAAGMMNRTTTRELCLTLARRTDPTVWNDVSNCTPSNVHQSAAAVSAHLACKNMTADVDMHFLPDGSVHGTVHMQGAIQGMHMTGEQTIDGQRIGSCDAGKAAG